MPTVTISDRSYKKLDEMAKYLNMNVDECVEWIIDVLYRNWFKEIKS